MGQDIPSPQILKKRSCNENKVFHTQLVNRVVANKNTIFLKHGYNCIDNHFSSNNA